MVVMGFVLPKYDEFRQSRYGDIIVIVVVVNYAAAEVLYLQWFLCDGLICEDAAEIVMVGEC